MYVFIVLKNEVFLLRRKSHFLPGVARPNRLHDCFCVQPTSTDKNTSFFRMIRNIQTLVKFWLSTSTFSLSTCDPRPSTCDPPPSTCDPRPSTCDLRLATLDPRPSILDPRLLTLHPRPLTLNPRQLLPQGPWQSRKKSVTFLRGGGGCLQKKRPYEVSRGQNRYVTLPLVAFYNPISTKSLRSKRRFFLYVLGSERTLSRKHCSQTVD